MKSSKDKPSSSSKHASTDSSAGPVTEDEIRVVLLQKSPVTAKDLVNVYFKARLRCDKVCAFLVLSGSSSMLTICNKTQKT